MYETVEAAFAAMEAGESEYAYIDGYEIDENYTDDQIVVITDRKIGEIKNQTSTAGEERSQVIIFQLPRYPDGIDLTKKTILVGYSFAKNVDGVNAPINVKANSEHILITWVMPAAAVQTDGDLYFIIHAIGDGYIYKTMPCTYTVQATLKTGGGIVIDNDWYADFVRQMDAKIAAAAVSTTAAQAAQTAAETAQGKAEAALVSTEGVLPELETKRVAALANIETSRTGALADVETARAGAQEILTQQAESTVKIDDVRRIAPVGIAEGAFVSVDDAADWRLAGLEVEGKSEQAQLTGKNLFGGIALANKINTIGQTSTLDEVNKTVTFDNIKSGASSVIYGEFKPNTQYTFILSASLLAGASNTSLVVKYADGTCKNINVNNTNKQNYTVVSQAGKSVLNFELNYYTNGLTSLHYNECGIFEGELTIGDFEPYCGGIQSPNPDYPQQIVSVSSPVVAACGKNLYPGTDVVTVTNYYKAIPILLPAGTYTISAEVESNDVDATGNIIVLRNGGVSIKELLLNRGGRNSKTFTITNSAEQLLLYASDGYVNLTGDTAIFKNIQLEAGAAETLYEPYCGNIATLTDISLRSLPDGTADKLCKRDGAWGVDRCVGLINGSDLNGYAESDYFILKKDDNSIFVKAEQTIFCNKLKSVPPYQTLKNNEIRTRSFGQGFVIRNVGVDYIQFKNTLTIQYALATPVWEPLPDTLQAQLNDLQSHTGQTNIFIDSSLQPELNVEYVQDINKLLAILQAQINSLQQA